MRINIALMSTALLSLGLVAVFSTSAQNPPAQQAEDPLAAAARKARAEQQAAPKPKKVYTNDDFASVPPPKATDAKSDAAQSDANAKGDSSNPADNDPKSEAYWRKRFAKVRDKLASAEKEVQVLQREFDKAEVQYYPDPQKALMQQYDRKDINDKRTKLDAKQKEVESLKAQISDMEDELRRAGGDPGWAR